MTSKSTLLQNASQVRSMVEEVILIEASGKLGDCSKPCTSRSFDIVADKLAEPGLATCKSHVMIYYQDNQTKIETEYRLFGVTSIIASVGGSMGLFLGFSCLDAAMYLVELVIDRYFG